MNRPAYLPTSGMVSTLRDPAPDSKDERVSPSNGSSPAEMAVPFATETYLQGSLDDIPMLAEAWTY
ncbi:hypothetical protein N7481_011350 [Penicillium waksmanii]|uniref:uncharacterized protein n=1 Tax=Penicillium waksmanii TaxID=69791 RepID=UPI0025496DA7|nr:uncharacterized protein N7481_011350 [Penicillium waksmanii]KAJ5974140.1 hypothetical protein N7481_011350 [Penicillium waksmanii]